MIVSAEELLHGAREIYSAVLLYNGTVSDCEQNTLKRADANAVKVGTT